MLGVGEPWGALADAPGEGDAVELAGGTGDRAALGALPQAVTSTASAKRRISLAMREA